jgi:hypothetical protein
MKIPKLLGCLSKLSRLTADISRRFTTTIYQTQHLSRTRPSFMPYFTPTRIKNSRSRFLSAIPPLPIRTSTQIDQIRMVESILNYQFRHPETLCDAFQAPGSIEVLTGVSRSRHNSHKWLALVGDAVLRLSIVDDGYQSRNKCHSLNFLSFCKLPLF